MYCSQYRTPPRRREVVWYGKECPGKPSLCMTARRTVQTASGSGTHTFCRCTCNSYYYVYFLVLIHPIVSLFPLCITLCFCVYQFIFLCVFVCHACTRSLVVHVCCNSVLCMDACVCMLHTRMCLWLHILFVPCVFCLSGENSQTSPWCPL